MQRQLALDGARGFSVLFIPAVHCFLVYGKPETHHSWIAWILRAIAEGPGVHVFLIIMGIVFTFKKRHTHMSILKRSAILLLAGYALNAAKFIVPYHFNGLPTALQDDLQLTRGNEFLQLLLMGDIFHCAAIALVMIHCMYRLPNYWFWSTLLAIVCVIISPLLPDRTDNYVVQLFTGAPPQVFFPVLSWIPYPLLGLTIGYAIQRRKNATIRLMAISGLLFTTVGLIILIVTAQLSPYGYYRPLAIESFTHIGIVFCYLWLWYTIAPRISTTPLFQLFQFLSQHITTFYAVQWLFICWLIPFTGYQTMNLSQTVMMAIYTTTVSFAITYFINNRKQL